MQQTVVGESEVAKRGRCGRAGSVQPPHAFLNMLRAVALALLAVAASGFVPTATPRQATALAASGSQIAYRIRRKRIANQVRDSAHHSLPAKLRLTCFSPQDKGRLRLNVFRSNNHIYAQVIDDKEGNTVCAASTLDESIKSENPKGNDRSAAGRVGALLAERAKAKGLDKLYFDRFSGSHKYLFHGRVKALVDGVREGGITV